MDIKQTLINNFSRHAATYARFCHVQNTAAARLLEMIGAGPFESIADLGCGPGNFTAMLHGKFAKAAITAVDISPEMIEQARQLLAEQNISFEVADAEKYETDKRFDLICSNACFQWFDDLAAALERYSKLLVPGGRLVFSIFGPQTFARLAGVIGEVTGQKAATSAGAFLDETKISEALSGAFGDCEIAGSTLTERYESMMEMLLTIKYTGTRGAGLETVRFDRGLIRRLEQAYLEKYNTLECEYQVIFCSAVKGV